MHFTAAIKAQALRSATGRFAGQPIVILLIICGCFW